MDCCNTINKDMAKALMPERIVESSKGTYGTVLNFSGCKEYIGAAYLSSKAPLTVGAGLVELACPAIVRDKVACRLPDIIYKDTNTQYYLETLPKDLNFSKYKAIIVGCGLGQNKQTTRFIKGFCDKVWNTNIPIIYDADALNIIAQENITRIGKQAIITPHPGEMARLMGVETAEVQADRESFAIRAAQKYHATVVLKGYHTIISTPDGKLYMDTSATNVLAKAGMGDVLTGIIAGLRAQGLNPSQACVLGVYIHSQAGICGETQKTSYSLLASELPDFIPQAIKSIIL